MQSLLLRAMAERTVSAFNREFRFPHMTVFADRNKVEKEETFELASAARDRFMLEVRMPTPTEFGVRRALVFDPAFHDVDELLEKVSPDVVPWQELNTIATAIQRSVTATTKDGIDAKLLVPGIEVSSDSTSGVLGSSASAPDSAWNTRARCVLPLAGGPIRS